MENTTGGMTMAEAIKRLARVPPPTETEMAMLDAAVHRRALDVPRWRRPLTKWWRS